MTGRSGPGPGRCRVGGALLGVLAVLALAAGTALAQCPWHRDVKELQSSCICAYNLGQELSVQCDMVDFPRLLAALDRFARDASLDLLYVNNSTVGALGDDAFRHLRLKSVQLSGCRIRSIGAKVFRQQEGTLKNLNLQDNELGEVPVEALRGLRNLTLLDLSRNRIERVPSGAFATLHGLATLKLADNNLSLAVDAFQGLEDTLKNLNLKGTRQKRVPEAIKGLRTLAFLDLAQNGLRELPGPAGALILEGLHSLSALNLERNLIQSVGETTFRGVKDTLSSLSLLNNLLTEFPAAAISSLHELRVLDIGFNLLTELPVNAFSGTPSLTLLALDGNPLAGVPERAVAHLNTTLRGLSLGGRFLACDCSLRWVAEWIARGDLQVTSRERNPQFCGSPAHLKDRSFYAIQPAELKCTGDKEKEVEQADESEHRPQVQEEPEGDSDSLDSDFHGIQANTATSPTAPPTTTTTTTTRATTVPTTTTTTTTTTTARPTPPPTTATAPPTTTTTTTTTTPAPTTTTTTTTTPRSTYRPTYKTRPSTVPTPPSTTTTTTSTTTRRGNGLVAARTTASPGVWRSNASPQSSAAPVGAVGVAAPAAPPASTAAHPPGHGPGLSGSASMHRPPLVLGFPGGSPAKHVDPEEEVKVRSAYRQDNSIIIQWDSHTANILGFRVVYRLFGDKSFKQGPPLEASEREFKIKNVPAQECIVVCVISLEEVNVTPEMVPYSQCREVRTVTSPSSNMDKITIAASAAICGTVVIAVIVFVAASRRRTRKLHTLQQHGSKNGIPAGGSVGGLGLGGGLGLPVGCCGPTPSPAGPLSSLATLSAFTNHKDWDQVSVYSNRSMGRAPRMYHVERQGSINAGCAADDVRTHASHFPSKPKTRSIADGQSQHSFSNHSGRYLSGNSFAPGLVNSPQELRHSRQSLAVSDRMSRVSYPASHATHHQPSVASSRRQRPRSRTRESTTNQSLAHSHAPSMTRPGSRYSAAGSTHTLNNYCDTSDNWTDHDMDIYMARNPTTRTGLVPL
ncbi:hypothetical protein FOCC_FOCC014719 [Frankliniella occidentalis]|uniref:Uncharacterized protein LOC113214299 isoform X1 n=1 Tax=Frankliniella occidentalis TaxID=133901 RepID=A0A6J1T7Z3_FRAOC|nr:uncharacterized protein LOC113214299 isoform X1 [Frankliniella occidentalis]KAE8739794.1 hypothetical protein FOCC_FOCC014719 [Frankliniella occidentalis]